MERSDGGQGQRRWHAYMDAAAARLQAVSSLDFDVEEIRCARQVILTPVAWNRWEKEFGAFMRPIAKFRSRMLQARSLRQAGCSWVHRATPFRYMRERQLRGEQRRQLVLGLHSHHSFARAMVAEHDTYVRSVCHDLCAAHLGSTLLDDPLYHESMRRYEALYMDYFQVFSAAHFPGSAPPGAPMPDLLPMLKQQLAELRHAILEYPLRSSWLRREAQIREPLGDTQRLRRFDLE